jgi:hypothetical protein
MERTHGILPSRPPDAVSRGTAKRAVDRIEPSFSDSEWGICRTSQGTLPATAAKIKAAHPRENQPSAWQQTWQVYTKRYDIKDRKILVEYLSRFVYRVAMTRNQLMAMDDHTVTYRYQDRETGEYRYETLDGVEFLLKFVRHVLPGSFHKTRKSGLYHYTRKDDYNRAIAILREQYAKELAERAIKTETDTQAAFEIRTRLRQSREQCPYCHGKNLYIVCEARYGESVNGNAGTFKHGGHTGHIEKAIPFQIRHGP